MRQITFFYLSQRRKKTRYLSWTGLETAFFSVDIKNNHGTGRRIAVENVKYLSFEPGSHHM